MSEHSKRSAPPPHAACERLAQMTHRQRRRAAAGFSRAERAAWAARYPSEVGLINDELPWLVADLADLD